MFLESVCCWVPEAELSSVHYFLIANILLVEHEAQLYMINIGNLE